MAASGHFGIRPLGNQDVPTQCIRIFRELYSNFTTKILPSYDDITSDVRRGTRKGDTVSPKLFIATLEDVMRTLEWDKMGVRVDCRLLHHLRLADDIVVITPSISQAEPMHFDKAEFDEDDVHEEQIGPGRPILAQRNDRMRMLQLRISIIGRKINMVNDLAPELGRS
ncbi:hypothetical protein Y032_1271g3793 [Ancylostoma ceylanicum]|uniref:Reverse transcriptase domain-containing protein n=1 Tax=Ancylostoma ceylanicum TaxID=53326 RepID=A0A016W514_9BILA|nr:hypothetical protein Y032_1271g3793 [Ancylostoma ceylanicum]